jgi:threonine/homoserine/homoserine lactone efflux protein
MDDEQKSVENSFKKLVNIAIVIMLVALIFIALFTFFFSMQDAISSLFDYRYVALVKSIFSLVIIGIGVYLVKMFLSR